jgi:Flp pilus assembly protein TadD
MLESVRSSVVRIETDQSSGSGFIFETPYPAGTALVLTNAHVIEGAGRITVTINDSVTLNANILGYNSSQDLAVLKMCCGRFHPQTALKFGDAVSLKPGDKVVVIGYPLGIPGRASVTIGIVSALRNDHGRWVIQTDAAINPGNSGGPLLSTSGHVLGINTYKYESTEGGRPVEGMGFAVSEMTIQLELPALKSGLLLPPPTRMPTPTPSPTRYYEEGKRLYDQGLYPQAIDQFTVAISVDSTRGLHYKWRGKSYYQLGLYQQAIQDFDQAIRMDPLDSYGYSWRGGSYYHLALYQQALQDFNQAIRLKPSADRYQWRGNIYNKLGQWQLARAEWDRACQLDSKWC